MNTIFHTLSFNDKLKFENIQNCVECPIKIYADFESFLEPINKIHGEITLYQRHTPSAFYLYVVSRVDGFLMDPITYVGEDAGNVVVEKLEQLAKQIYQLFKDPVPVIFDEAARRLDDTQNVCYACVMWFKDDDVKLRKVRDHCYYMGRYRGALHSKCNLRLRRTRTIPVLFHNLKGYDSHLFVIRLADTPGYVSCIPQNEEKYITFT